MKKKWRVVLVTLSVVVMGGRLAWALGNAPARTDATRRLASQAGFSEKNMITRGFTLKSWTRVRFPRTFLRVYIEGDGHSWNHRGTPSMDPTPVDPVALKLAVADTGANVAYLARPCQYVRSEGLGPCEEKYWTDARFSEEVIQSVSQALDQLKALYGLDRLDLVGYSGGAAVALLVAERRSDIDSIRTVAGALDTDAVNKFHGLGPIKDSLNPTGQAAKLAGIPERHFVGGKDKVVPAFIADGFVRLLGPGACAEIVKVPDTSHSKGWVEKWKELLLLPVSC